VAIGFLRVLQFPKNFSYDAIPADAAVNAILVIAKQVADRSDESQKIFNLVSNCGSAYGGLNVHLLIEVNET
jgi:hypothetical protein